MATVPQSTMLPSLVEYIRMTRIPLRVGKSSEKGSLSPSSPFFWEICAFLVLSPRVQEERSLLGSLSLAI